MSSTYWNLSLILKDFGEPEHGAQYMPENYFLGSAYRPFIPMARLILEASAGVGGSVDFAQRFHSDLRIYLSRGDGCVAQ